MRFVFWLCVFMLACGGAEPRTVAPPRPTPASNTGTLVGHVASDAGEAHELMRGLPEDRAPADVRAFEAKLKEKNKDVDIKIYDGAQDAFMNPNDATGYDPAASKDAWSRIGSFSSRTLARQN